MFSDRLWIVKAAAALALLGWLSWQTRLRVSREHPEVERVAVFHESLRGLDIHISPRKVITADASGFGIETRVGPMRVTSATPPRVGQTVTVVARATGPRTLEAVALQVNEGHEWKRPLNYVASVITLIAFLWLIRSRFRWNPEAGVFRGRY